MPTPDFVLALRAKIGHDPLWLMGVSAVVLDGSRTLLVRRSDTGAWTPVTGIVDPGEEPAVAAERETLEEAGVVVRAHALTWVHVIPPVTYDNGDVSQYVDLTFRCDFVSGEPWPADGENTDAAWFDLDNLPDMAPDMVARIRSAVDFDGTTRFVR
ncbi:8-oxo-dGTP pyrophosphatase MutT (NUDIX family) [Microbacteriaceae bacterium SG_E_30_P1]|uniref:8-oxo-dGTP pyrophosphatase MutT (NUDIX family) n=1 Tax=Antiquaquibacter oligotrophicus TaxID=2880260 RepID=A0ABT6KRX0_9MICO|nr:NUDIX domain-containing protein [Antiquaquibacter oligotrophicus]MDH6182545.1 8-oxo-dGTP pyrophosphatase MutT (NUDIX family) [Antiquaquibacter oligotrophicus]UDF14488.1 NUDIX domain-containing protein [Antiquaquibacter oligotrophicus]